MITSRSVSSYALNGFLRAFVRPALQKAARSRDYVDLRNRGAALGERFSNIPKSVDRSETLLESLPVTWFSSKDVNRETVLLYLHGGGFAMPALGMHFAFCAQAALRERLLVAMPHYRLAPEHPFPAAVDDCLLAYRWLLEHGYRPENIVLAGDSAGGNLALTTLLLAKQGGLPMPSGAVLMSPALKLNVSMETLKDAIDPMFSTETLSGFMAAYCPNGIDSGDARQSPLLGDFAGLPPLHIVVGGAELLKPDSIEAAEKAKACGVEVQLTVVEGLPHVFPLIDVLPEAVKAQQEIFAFFRTHLAVTTTS